MQTHHRTLSCPARWFSILAVLATGCGAPDDMDTETIPEALSVTGGQAYTITGVQSGKCVEIAGSSTANSAQAQIASCNGTTRQQFRFEDQGGGYFRVRNVNSNLCLDVEGASTTAGAHIIQWTCGTAQNQQWRMGDISSTVTEFIVRHSGQAMDVSGAGTADGTRLIQWTVSASATNQQFRLTAVGGGTGGTGGTTGGTGGSTSTGGTGGSSGGTARLIGGTCYPVCASAASDPDGDGWGWENSASCVVVGSTPYNSGTACGGSGTGGSGGTATGGTGGTCAVAPANPNASPQARKLLCYLYQTYTRNVLSGQQETSWSNPENDITWYVNNVGKYPAILGGDYLYPNGTSTRAIAYWNAGGIPMIRYHMGAPPNSDTYQNSMGSTNIANVLTVGTAEYNSFVSKLNYAAGELQKLEDAGVAVLWAPFHETQPNGWFWWSKGTSTQFKQLWVFMFNYFTKTKGLNNIVWLMPFSGSPNSGWLPDRATIDIAGPDTYATNQPFSSLYSSARSIVGTTMPIPLHETGVVPQPSQMFPTAAPWVLWNIWAGYQISNNSLSNIRSAYASSYTITRDEIPSLK